MITEAVIKMELFNQKSRPPKADYREFISNKKSEEKYYE
jgi:hypothetical protein